MCERERERERERVKRDIESEIERDWLEWRDWERVLSRDRASKGPKGAQKIIIKI